MPAAAQTAILPSSHADLVTDVAYDFYGLHLATCGLDQRIKLWRMDEQTGSWTVEHDWKAHDAPITKLSWAHPEHGGVIASSSFDRTVKIWEEVRYDPRNPHTRWVERAVLSEARGSVRAVEFAPRFFGLKLASIASDSQLRVYECQELHNLTTWTLTEVIDLATIPSSSPILAMSTPTQTHATLDGAPSAVSTIAPPPLGIPFRVGSGNREADGGWSLSWCKDKDWGELAAVSAGGNGVVRIIEMKPGQQPTFILKLVDQKNDPTSQFAITTVAWAPSCGRSYHLIATGGRDGILRIWKVKPPPLGKARVEEKRWSANVVGEFDEHHAPVTRVEWNITGTVLSSAGNDGNIRLWKATYANVWRPMGHIHTEQGDEPIVGDQMAED